METLAVLVLWLPFVLSALALWLFVTSERRSWRHGLEIIKPIELKPLPPAHGAPVYHRDCARLGELIELGYARRAALLERPGVKDVEVSLSGEHLVLTVYQSKPVPTEES